MDERRDLASHKPFYQYNLYLCSQIFPRYRPQIYTGLNSQVYNILLHINSLNCFFRVTPYELRCWLFVRGQFFNSTLLFTELKNSSSIVKKKIYIWELNTVSLQDLSPLKLFFSVCMSLTDMVESKAVSNTMSVCYGLLLLQPSGWDCRCVTFKDVDTLANCSGVQSYVYIVKESKVLDIQPVVFLRILQSYNAAFWGGLFPLLAFWQEKWIDCFTFCMLMMCFLLCLLKYFVSRPRINE